MIQAFAVLLFFQFLGEVCVKGLGLPLPGPLIGMLLLFVALLVHGRVPEGLRQLAQSLIGNLMLLFIPAVSGVMIHWQKVAADGVAFVVSGVLATALTLKIMLRVLALIGPGLLAMKLCSAAGAGSVVSAINEVSRTCNGRRMAVSVMD